MQYVTLSDGNKIPVLGYGVFTLTDLEECRECTKKALALGYRHVDTAQVYKNEEAVGDGMKESGVPRAEIFLTTKLWTTSFGEQKSGKFIDLALQKLKTDYVDLMLLHRPFSDYKGAWRALIQAQREGKCRSIGVSNFNERQIEELIVDTGVTPCVNQVELHPYGQQSALKQYHAEKGIATESWYPLGHGDEKLLSEPTLAALAEKYQKSTSQILLRWQIQEGNIVFPRARSQRHMAENFDLFGFELSREDVEKIRAMDEERYYDHTPVWIQKIMANFQC